MVAERDAEAAGNKVHSHEQANHLPRKRERRKARNNVHATQECRIAHIHCGPLAVHPQITAANSMHIRRQYFGGTSLQVLSLPAWPANSFFGLQTQCVQRGVPEQGGVLLVVRHRRPVWLRCEGIGGRPAQRVTESGWPRGVGLCLQAARHRSEGGHKPASRFRIENNIIQCRVSAGAPECAGRRADLSEVAYFPPCPTANAPYAYGTPAAGVSRVHADDSTHPRFAPCKPAGPVLTLEESSRCCDDASA
eukprot:351879-Chlamydomonas_euryale.AAC.21